MKIIVDIMHRRFVYTMLPVFAAASVLLAGCSLAKTDTPENTGTDRLCGVWVVSDTNICFNNPEGFEDDDSNYIGIEEIPDMVSDTTSGSNITASADKPIFTRGNIFLDNYVQNTAAAANSTLSVTGALYLSSDKACDEYMVSIYQRPDGTYYRGIISATSYSDNRIPTPLSISETQTFSSSEGVAQSNTTEIAIAFEVRDACTGTRIIEMDKDSLVIKTTDLNLNHTSVTSDSDYEINTLPETSFVIVEESSAADASNAAGASGAAGSAGTSAKIYRTIYCRSEQSGSLPVTHIIAVPGDSEVLIPQKLQITFG